MHERKNVRRIVHKTVILLQHAKQWQRMVKWMARHSLPPAAHNPPVREFSSERVSHKRDAPPCCCAPKPPVRTVPVIEEIVETFVEGGGFTP